MRTRAVRPFLCLSLAVLSLSACNAAAGTHAAEQAVQRHHELYNAQRFEVMYHVADAELKQAVPSSGQFASVTRGFYQKLGPSSSSKRVGFILAMTPGGGTRVTLLYETQFEQGAGTEEFVYRIRGGKAGLVRWQVNSPVFLQDAADSTGSPPVPPPGAAGGGTGG